MTHHESVRRDGVLQVLEGPTPLIVTPWFSVERSILGVRGGGQREMYAFRRPMAVAVIARRAAPDGRICFVEEFRHPVRANVLGLPGGGSSNLARPPSRPASASWPKRRACA